MLAVLGAPPAARAADATVRLDVGLAGGADAVAVVDRLTRPLVDWATVAGLDAITIDVAAAERDTVLAQLAADADVRYAEPGSTVHADSPHVDIPQYASNDPYVDSNGPNYRWLEMSQVPQAWTWTLGSASVSVAVVDTGVTGNPDLGADRLAAGWDFVDGDADASDDDDHGTQVANLIAGERNNRAGGAGICSKCRVLPVRVLGHRDGRSAEGTSADVAAGIVWAADHGADVINLSLSTSTRSRLLAEAVEHADSRGALVVGSAGQTATTARQFPAGFDQVLAVGSINEYGAPSIGSNHNSATDQWIDVLAPDGIWVLGRDGTSIQLARGTSAATAIVSGTAALALAVRPEATADQVRTAIVSSTESGIGLIRVEPYDARILNAARLVHDFGGLPDGEAPRVTGVGLVDGQVIGVGNADIVRSVSVTDDHGIARLELVVGGRVVDSTHAAGWARDLVLDPASFDGDLPVTVRAVDYAGRQGEKTVTVHIDGTGPAGTITSPREGEHVGGHVKVVFTSTGDDVAGALVNGFPMTRTAGTNQWSAAAPPQLLDANTWGFVLDAIDPLGNHTTLRRLVVNDYEGPTATSISPTANARVRGTFTSTINGAEDGAGVARADLWAGNTYIGRDTTAPYSLKVPTRAASGSLVLMWNLTDRLGNVRTYRRTVVADNKAPTVSITKAPKNGARVSGTVKVSVKATDASGIARVELLINGKVVATDTKAGYVLAFRIKAPKKTMKVQVRAYDKLGNVKYTTTRTWKRA
ncbi:S8 family serine peptidase [Paractinoplanes toevensis]|nr:S8 family serine peptidase [Actinoplanes toevensis]